LPNRKARKDVTHSKVRTFDLPDLPDGTELRGVKASATIVQGRRALRVSLADQVKSGTYGVDYVDEPTFVLLPVELTNGVIEVDILGRLLPDAPEYARAFVGLAYRVQTGSMRYESVYLRPLNGRQLNPPPPRDARAVQYYSYPDWKFDRLRAEEPSNSFEAGADIAPDKWTRVRLEVRGFGVMAFIDGKAVLTLKTTKAEPARGRIGLWVDIGTEGFFTNLRIQSCASDAA
jgi:hypothetical protein